MFRKALARRYISLRSLFLFACLKIRIFLMENYLHIEDISFWRDNFSRIQLFRLRNDKIKNAKLIKLFEDKSIF